MRVAKARDVATLLGVHIDKVYEMAQTGELPQLRRVGPELRFDLDQIEDWLRGHPVDTSRTPASHEALRSDEATR